MSPEPSPQTGGQHVVAALSKAGVETVVGIPGTQTLPLDKAIAGRDDIDYVMARHETAIPHIAWGYYEAGGGLAATVTIPGPGDTNAMHGLKNALNDCVPFIHVSAEVDPCDRGKAPLHEIDAATFESVVKKNITVERPSDVAAQLARGIEVATTAPYGPVRLGIPNGILYEEFVADQVSYKSAETDYENATAYAAAIDLLARSSRPAIHIGGGIRRAAGGTEVVWALAELLDAPVTTTFKGKGGFPEDDPRYLGSTGPGLPSGAERVLDRADVVLALGTDFDGLATNHWEIPMGDSLIHVDIDPDVIGAAYETEVGIVASVTTAGERLLEGIEADTDRTPTWDGAELASDVREEYLGQLAGREFLADKSQLHAPTLLRSLRDVLPPETVVTSDVGNYLVWAKQLFEVYEPANFVTAGSWAGMGVGLPAAIGAKLARPERPVVSLTGDGGLFMCIQELATAAEYDLDITVVVFNNSDYGIISKKPQIREEGNGRRFEWRSPSFVELARGFGCRGTTVETPLELEERILAVLDNSGPDIIEVLLPADEPLAADTAKYDSQVDVETLAADTN